MRNANVLALNLGKSTSSVTTLNPAPTAAPINIALQACSISLEK
jgi:hypothetical protein